MEGGGEGWGMVEVRKKRERLPGYHTTLTGQQGGPLDSAPVDEEDSRR